MKIAIVGSPGSGKSTLAFQLQKILNIPLFHLDQYFWQPGWQRPDREAFKKIHHQLCDEREWIIEGMSVKLFDYRAQQADVIIFLDIPLYVCFYRTFKRAFCNFGKVLASSAKGCPEQFPSLEFSRYVWNFNKHYKPEIDKLLQKYRGQKKIFILKNNDEINQLLEKFKSNTI